MESFSNKSHDGFLGHSHLGSWVNLGAGTVTANLKVSYGMIKIYPPDNNVIKTKRQFFECFVVISQRQLCVLPYHVVP